MQVVEKTVAVEKIADVPEILLFQFENNNVCWQYCTSLDLPVDPRQARCGRQQSSPREHDARHHGLHGPEGVAVRGQVLRV